MYLIGKIAPQGQQSQKGFSLIESMAVLSIAALFILGVMWAKRIVDESLTSNQFTREIATIATQARAYRGLDLDYVGIEISLLTGMGLLPTGWGSGVGANPLGGNYTLSANATDKALVDLLVTGLTSSICLSVANKIKGSTHGGNKATCAGGTLTAIFR